MFKAIKRALKGEEKAWKVFWLWGWLLYITSILIGFGAATDQLKNTFFANIVGFLGLILIFIYPFMLCWSLWFCSKNTKYKWFTYFLKIYAIAFIPAIHIWVGLFVFVGSVILLGSKF